MQQVDIRLDVLRDADSFLQRMALRNKFRAAEAKLNREARADRLANMPECDSSMLAIAPWRRIASAV